MLFAKKYISLAKMTMQDTLAYRSSYFINLVSGWIFVLSMFYLWKAIFNGREYLSGYSWEQMKAYLFITLITNSLISWYSETRISKRILSGDVAIDLLKPIDFQKARLAETIGSSILEGFIAIFFIGTILIFSYGIIMPSSAKTGTLFVFSLIASLLIKFGIVYLSSTLCFWTSSGIGIAWMRATVTNFFSGALIPLTFFPGWLKTITHLLPFQGIVFIPASIYLGTIDGLLAWQSVGLQWFWVVFLWGLGKVIWSFAVRKVTINGG